MKILVISGSPRKRSYTRALANHAYEYAKGKYKDAHLIDLGLTKIENFRGFDEGYDETTVKAVELLEGSDVIIICTPVYNGVFSSAVKNLFEFVDYKALEGKCAGFALMSGGTISFLQVQGQLIAMMNYFRVLSNPRAVFVSTDSFDSEYNLTSDGTMVRLKRLVDETVSVKKRIGAD